MLRAVNAITIDLATAISGPRATDERHAMHNFSPSVPAQEALVEGIDITSLRKAVETVSALTLDLTETMDKLRADCELRFIFQQTVAMNMADGPAALQVYGNIESAAALAAAKAEFAAEAGSTIVSVGARS